MAEETPPKEVQKAEADHAETGAALERAKATAQNDKATKAENEAEEKKKNT